MTAVFFLPLCTIFIFRNIMQGCGYGFLPMMGGVGTDRETAGLNGGDPASELSAGVLRRSGGMDRSALFTGISYLFVIKKIEKNFRDSYSFEEIKKTGSDAPKTGR